MAVFGGGTAGRGIARALAAAGTDVILVEVSDAALGRALDTMREGMNRDIARWSITEGERDAVMARITGTVRLEDAATAPVVVEAIPEDFKEKTRLFARLDAACLPETVLLTNTSTLSVTELAEAVGPARRPRMAGFHVIHPVTRVPLVELVRGRETGDAAVETALALARLLGKEVVEVGEYPGFVTSRLTLALVNEAVTCLGEGVATRDSIDRAMKLQGLSQGPLALADEIGLDSVVRALESLWSELGLPQYRPAPILRLMVSRGWLGEKSGRGFYRYDETGCRLTDEAPDFSRPPLEDRLG